MGGFESKVTIDSVGVRGCKCRPESDMILRIPLL